MFPYILFILTIIGLTAVNLIKEWSLRRRLQPLRVPVNPKTEPQGRSDSS